MGRNAGTEEIRAEALNRLFRNDGNESSPM
jgi:hypothetical protein